MSQCLICQQTFDRGKPQESKIQCKFCNKEYHPECTNPPVTIAKAKWLNSTANIFWCCENCVNLSDIIPNLLNKLCEIEQKVDKNSELLNKQSEVLNKVQKVNDLRINNTALHSATTVTKRRYADVIADATPVHENSTPKRPKNSVKIPTKQVHDPIVIVKKAKSDVQIDVKQKVKEALNPATDPVKYYTTSAQGKLVIHCKDHGSVAQVKQRLQQEIGKDVVVEEPKSVKPRLTVFGVDPDFVFSKKSDDEVMVVASDDDEVAERVTEPARVDFANFIDMLRKQNDCLKETNELEVVTTKKRNNGTVDVVLSTDTNTFNKLVEINKIVVGFELCRVRENLLVLRCYNCNQYNHTAKECKQSASCPKCAGPHKITDCDQQNMSKCINCIRAKQELNLNHDVNHRAWSTECPVYQRYYNKKKGRMRFST